MVQTIEVPRELTKEIRPGPGAATRAEVEALLHVHRGEPIPPIIREAVLLTATDQNRVLLQENFRTWEETTKSFPPQKAEVFGKFALTNLGDAMALNARDYEHLQLRKINLAQAFELAGEEEILVKH